MNFSLWASKKLQLGCSSGANSTGVAIAVAGVALALIIMECSLAIVLGFKNQITDRILGFDAQVSVLPPYNPINGVSQAHLQLDPKLLQDVNATILEGNASLKFSLPGILKTENDFAGIYFVGYDQNHPYTFEGEAVKEGTLPDFFNTDDANKIAISTSMANSLGLKLGDRPYAYFFENEAVKQRRMEVAAIYETGFSDYDKTIAFAALPTLQRVAGIDSLSGSSLAIDGIAFSDIEDAAYDLQERILWSYHNGERQELYPVDNVRHTGAIFFNWLDLLDTNVVVIFILMTFVAGFTLVSSMFILILDRIPTIGLLRSLGATRRQVRMVFVNLAMKIIVRGLCIGNVIGLGILLLQLHFKWIKLNPEMYYLPYVPVEINWWWMLALNIGVTLAAWCILVLPSRLAANISPASTMRYE